MPANRADLRNAARSCFPGLIYRGIRLGERVEGLPDTANTIPRTISRPAASLKVSRPGSPNVRHRSSISSLTWIRQNNWSAGSATSKRQSGILSSVAMLATLLETRR